jgi:hypothetical protein
MQQQGNKCQEKHPQSGIDYRFYFIQDIKYKEVAMDVYKLEYTGVMTL